MYCVKCGATLPNGANFCPNCGASADQTRGGSEKKEAKTVQFRCKGCGHIMEIDPNSPILRCSICGSNELILEGDDVTVQRIKSRAYKDVKLGEQQTYKEVELGKKELELKSSKSRFSRLLISFSLLLAGAIAVVLSFQYNSMVGACVGVILLAAGIILVIFTVIASIASTIKDAISGKNRHVNNPSKTAYQRAGHATKEDVELAKVHAEEKNNKTTLIVLLILMLVCFGLMAIFAIIGE